MKISAKVESDPKWEEKVRETLNQLESGDEKVREEFRNVVDIAIKGQAALFSELDIKYDVFDYESKYLFGKQTNEALGLLKKQANSFLTKTIDSFLISKALVWVWKYRYSF